MDSEISYKAKDNELLYIVDSETGEINKEKYATKKEIHKQHLYHNEAALFIINSKGKILLQKRSQNVHFNKGKWGMIANHPNINQSNIESLLQKSQEEIGFTFKEEEVMFLTVAKRDEEQKNKFAYFYYIKTDIKDKDIKLEPYLATEYKWWDFYELKTLMLNNSNETVFKNIPFYIYVFKELEKIVTNLDTGKTIRYKEFLIAETSDKVKLPCVLHRPKKATKNLVIFVHGSGSNFFKSSWLNDMVNRLTYSSCAVLTTSNRGAEQETHLYKEVNGLNKKFLAGNKYEIFDESIYDIQSFIDLANNQGYKNIVLVGHSLGTLKVLNYALHNKNINNIVLMSPVDMIFRFKARVKEKYDEFIELAKQCVENGEGTKLLTDEFSAQKIWSTFRCGGLSDTIAFEEERANRVLDYNGNVVVIKGTSDHVYSNYKHNYSPEYIDNVLKKEFSKANLVIRNIVNANHGFKGYAKYAAQLLSEEILKLLN